MLTPGMLRGHHYPSHCSNHALSPINGGVEEAKEKPKAGQPTKYRPEYCKLALNYCLLRATDKDLGRFLGVDESTINNWKIAHPEFLESINAGKEEADAEVASALKHRAMGYSHQETKVFATKVKAQKEVEGLVVDTEEIVVTKVDVTKHYPPDTAAAFIWLKNRAGWKDKSEVEQIHHIVAEKVDFKNVCVRVEERKVDGDGIPTD